ncbi:MAG TPA: 50S ribosomal protein L25 [Acidimicrobiales bacterium]
MAEITLAAQAGRPTGSGACNRLRAAGRIPAVVYGHGMDPLAISVEGRDLRSALTTESGLNALLSLDVDGTSHLTLAREIQRHPVRHSVTHVDFQIVRRDEIVSAEVPVTLTGEAQQVAMNQGVIEQPLISLTVQAVPDRIPNSIEVDISALAIGDTIRVADLPLPEGVTTEVDGDEAVVIAQGSALAAQVAADEELTPAADEAPVAPVESPEG